ncbi:MAG: DegV family protein [Clostridia bacterium]|nr:DegV family protein [Clostridia bacterium]
MRIMTDAAADLTAEEAQKLGVEVVPTITMLGGEAYQAGVDLPEAFFWQRVLAEAEG